jgi:hypothetical protein
VSAPPSQRSRPRPGRRLSERDVEPLAEAYQTSPVWGLGDENDRIKHSDAAILRGGSS